MFTVIWDASNLRVTLEDLAEDVEEAIAPTMAIVAEMLVAAVSDQYDSQGDGKWPGHADSYIKFLQRKYGGDQKLMNLSGVLSGSTAAHSGATWAEASTDVPYVVYHLDGGPVIPQRNPFLISDEALDEIEDFVIEQLGKAAE